MPRRRLPIPLLLALVLAALAIPAGAGAQGSVPEAVPLNTGWQVARDPDGPWTDVRLPHVVDPRPTARSFRGSVAWYRLRFRAPQAVPGFGWAFRFEQVRRTARVTLNGQEIGRHTDPYTPFTVPARALRAGEENVLKVRVDWRKGAEPREGWWNWGGITRQVSLVPEGALVLRDAGVMSRTTCEDGGERCTARALVDGWVENRSGTAQPDPRVKLSLLPPGGGDAVEAVERVRALAPGEVARVRFEVPVEDPQLWAPERPQRYAASLTTLAGEEPQQIDRRLVGLRDVRVQDGMLLLNGKQLALRGASIQEDVPGRGPAMADRDVKGIVDGLKALGTNVTRAHYLLDPRLLDAFDSAGILVWSQAPVYHRDELLKTAAGRDAALATLRGTVLAARSHPSVLTHSVANELSPVPDDVPGTRRYLRAARDLVADLDPTLPASVDLLSYPGYPRQASYAQFPLLGINSYFGWYAGKRDHPTADIRDLGPFLDRMRRGYDSSALVVTEFGAESTFEGPADEKESFAFQSRYFRDVMAQLDARPWVGGAIYWTLREFAVKPEWDGGAGRKVARDSIHNKGLITYTGRRKPAWRVARSEFTSTPTYREVPRAAALGLPDGRDGGSPLLLVGLAALVLVLLAVDVWAVLGILRGRRRVPAGHAGGGSLVVQLSAYAPHDRNPEVRASPAAGRRWRG